MGSGVYDFDVCALGIVCRGGLHRQGCGGGAFLAAAFFLSFSLALYRCICVSTFHFSSHALSRLLRHGDYFSSSCRATFSRSSLMQAPGFLSGWRPRRCSSDSTRHTCPEAGHGTDHRSPSPLTRPHSLISSCCVFPPSSPPRKGYDGGDCCACTCESEALCGTSRDFGGGFDCVDPDAKCGDEEDGGGVDEETGCNDGTLGNSACDEENNNEACGEPAPCRDAINRALYHAVSQRSVRTLSNPPRRYRGICVVIVDKYVLWVPESLLSDLL